MDIIYKEINKANFESIIKLSDSLKESQKSYVASNLYSIAESTLYPNNAFYRAIYLGDEPIGFFMVFIPDEESIKDGDKDFFLWRYMIIPEHQRKGIGQFVLKHIIKLARLYDFNALRVSCDMDKEAGPYKFYMKYGFIDTKEIIDDELILELKFD